MVKLPISDYVANQGCMETVMRSVKNSGRL